MAGFKQGALQLKKNDSELPADIGHIKVLVNTDSQLYTVDENGVSALIQGGGSGGPVYWKDIKNIPTASSSTSGVLTSADWNAFNDKLTSAALVGYATLSGNNTFTGNNRFNVLLSATNGIIGGELVGPFDKQYYLNNDSLTFTDNGSGTTTKIDNSSSTSSLETNAQVYNILRDGMNVIYASTSQTRLGSLNIAYTVVDAQSGVNINTDQTNINSNLDVYGSTSIHGNISANSFVTNGGTSAQFVAGNGDLIYTSAIIPNIGVASSTTSGVITSADYNNFSNHNISTGVIGDVAPIATYGFGTVSIEGSQVNLHSDSAHTSPIITYTLTSATFTLTDGLEQYIVADYNSGSPIYRLENNKTNINSSNVVLIRVCWRAGNTVHSVDYDSSGSGLANKIEAAIIQTTPYKKSLDGGLTLSETNIPVERTVIVTSSVVFAGTTPHTLSAFNSSSNKLTFASVANGVWSYTSGTTQYNNTQYNPSVGLSTLGNNNYGVVWLYRSVGNDVEVFYVLGDSEYPTIAKAQTSKLRSDISLLLRDHCVLIGRIIIQKGATAGVVENVADVSFASSSITNHNDLNNIQGGSVGEYYHLSATQYNQLTSGGDTSLHNHSFDRNRSNHTGTQLASTISDFTSASRVLLSATTPISYSSASGAFSHSTTGTAGTYTKIVTDTFGHITSGSVLTSADIPILPWSKVTNTPTTLSAYGVTSADTLFDGKYLGINGIAQGALSATQADKLKTARTIATSGDIVGTATSFDGTANITISTTLPNIVTANTKTKIVYNAKGQVTSGGDLVASDIPALGSIYQLLSEENQAMGYAGLDAGKKIYTSALPDSILGQLHYMGTWNATTNTPALPNPNIVSGGFYIVSVSGTYAISNISPNSVNGDWRVGDWLVSDGTYWDKVDNSDAISMFNGRIGAITPIASDYSAFYPLLTSAYNNPSWVNTLDWSKIVNEPTTLAGYGITTADTLFDGKYATSGHLHTGQYLPLSGGTLNGPLTGTSATFSGRISQNGIATWQGLVGYESAMSVIYGGGVTPTTQNYGLAVQKDGTYTTINGTTGSMMAVNNTAILTVTSASVSIAKPTIFTSRGTQAGYTIWDAGNLTNLNQLTNGPGYVTSAVGGTIYAPIVHNHIGQDRFEAQNPGVPLSTQYTKMLTVTVEAVGTYNNYATDLSVVCNYGALGSAKLTLEVVNSNGAVTGYNLAIHSSNGDLTPNSFILSVFGTYVELWLKTTSQQRIYSWEYSHTRRVDRFTKYSNTVWTTTAPTITTYGSYSSTSFLSLAGGTLTGPLSGTTASFTGSVTSNSVFIAQQTQSGNVAGNGARIALIDPATTAKGWIIQHGQTDDKLQFFHQDNGVWTEKAYLTSAGSFIANGTIWEGGQSLSTKYAATSHLHTGQYLPLSGGTLTGPLTGTTAAFSGSATFHNSIQKPWNVSMYPIGLGGECGTYNYLSIEPALFANCYYDGSNWKWYSTATNTRYAKLLQLSQSGGLNFFTSVTSPTADANIPDLTVKFSVSKEGDGVFLGTISEGGALLSNKYGRLATSNTWTALNYFNGGLSQQFGSVVIGSRAISINRAITLSYIYASGYQYDGTLRQGDDGLNIESFESPVKISTTKFGLHTTNNNTYIESWYTGGPSYHLDLYTKDTMTLEAKKIVINGTLWANNIVNVSTTLSAPTTANTSWYTYAVVYIASTGILKLPPASSFTGSLEIHISIAYNAILTINGSGISSDSFNSININCSTGLSTIMPYNGGLTNIHFYATVKWIFAAEWQIVYE